MKQYLTLVAAALLIVTALVLVAKSGKAHTASRASDIISDTTTSTADEATYAPAPSSSAKSNFLDSVDKKSVYQVNLDDVNTVVLTGEIGENSIQVAQEISAKAKSRPIFLLINSPGGSVLDGVAIVGAIQAAKNPVYTVCLQLCASMASIIFESGTKRLMVDRSVLMFHEAAGQVQGPFNQMKTRLNFFNRFVNKMDYEIATRVGIDPEVFRAQLANELWIDAEDAVRQNYADKLVNVNIEGLGSRDSGQPQEKVKSQTKALQEKVNVNL